MHEYHIVESVVNAVRERAIAAKASRVTMIRIALGDRSGLAEESIKMYFESISQGTSLESAVLEFKPLANSQEFYIEDIEIETE
jgi:Zn finger protein HypA/HybF involved in hydrogenase expression